MKLASNILLTGKIQRIPNWYKKGLTCYFCGSDKSVKYQIESKNKNRIIFCCNTCLLSAYR